MKAVLQPDEHFFGFGERMDFMDQRGRKVYLNVDCLLYTSCTDRNGTDRLPVSVSRLNEPEYSYTLVKEDVGYYLMAAIAPKRCV